MTELCTPVAQIAERQHLRSPPTRRAKYIQLNTYGRRTFAVVGPTVWNSLGNDLRDPGLSIASFDRLLKTHLFQQYSIGAPSASEALCDDAPYKFGVDIEC